MAEPMQVPPIVAVTTPPPPFRPNFNQPNPYAGMTPEYADLVAKTFVPTPENPLSPVQQAAINGQLQQDIITHPAIINLTPEQQKLTGAKALTDIAPIVPSKTVVQPVVTTWKPDFNQPNPYKDVPPEYVKLVGETFVPTAENPVNPIVASFVPTGNVPKDLATLKTIGANSVTVATYMAEYGKSWGVTEDTPNASSEEIKAAQYLKSLGFDPSKPYIEIDTGDPTKGILRIQSDIWDKATPEFKFYYFKNIGQIPQDAKLIKYEDGTWGYATYGKLTSDDGIPSDLYQTYLANKDRYASFGKSPPLHFDETRNGYVTVIPYIDPSKAVTYQEQIGLHLVFRNDGGYAVINKIIDEKTNTDILKLIDGKYDKDGNFTFNQNSLISSVVSGKLKSSNLIYLLGSENASIINKLVEDRKNAIQEVASRQDVKIADVNNVSDAEIRNLLTKGIPGSTLVALGVNYDKVQSVVDAINAEYKQYEEAQNKLVPYGKRIVGVWTEEHPEPPPSFSVEALAKFQRDNPNDTTTLANYYGDSAPQIIDKVSEYNKSLTGAVKEIENFVNKPQEKLNIFEVADKSDIALTDALKNSGVYDDPNYVTNFSLQTGLLSHQLNSTLWNALTDEQKNKVAYTYNQDIYRGNWFAEVNKQVRELAASAGIVGQIAFSPVLPITNVVAKQLTLPEARVLLNKQYATELSVVKDYLNKNGTVDINKLEYEAKTNSDFKDKVLKDAGYDNFDSLKQNLQYYNSAIRVTGEELRTAGAVGAIDILMMGGSGALAELGLGGRLVSSGVYLGSAGIFLPSTIKVVKSPDVPIGEKILAVGGEILLVTGGVMSLKAPKVAGENIKTTGVKAVASEIEGRGIPTRGIESPVVGIVDKAINTELANSLKVSKTAYTLTEFKDMVSSALKGEGFKNYPEMEPGELSAKLDARLSSLTEIPEAVLSVLNKNKIAITNYLTKGFEDYPEMEPGELSAKLEERLGILTDIPDDVLLAFRRNKIAVSNYLIKGFEDYPEMKASELPARLEARLNTIASLSDDAIWALKRNKLAIANYLTKGFEDYPEMKPGELSAKLEERLSTITDLSEDALWTLRRNKEAIANYLTKGFEDYPEMEPGELSAKLEERLSTITNLPEDVVWVFRRNKIAIANYLTKGFENYPELKAGELPTKLEERLNMLTDIPDEVLLALRRNKVAINRYLTKGFEDYPEMKAGELQSRLEARLDVIDLIKERPEYYRAVMENLGKEFTNELNIASQELKNREMLESLRSRYKAGMLTEEQVLTELAHIVKERQFLQSSKDAMLIRDIMGEKSVEGISSIDIRLAKSMRNLLVNMEKLKDINNRLSEIKKIVEDTQAKAKQVGDVKLAQEQEVILKKVDNLLNETRELMSTDLSDISPEGMAKDIFAGGLEGYKEYKAGETEFAIKENTLSDIELKLKNLAREQKREILQTKSDLQTYLDSVQQRLKNVSELDADGKRSLINDMTKYLDSVDVLRKRMLNANEDLIRGIEEYLKNPSEKLSADVQFNPEALQDMINRIKSQSEIKISQEEINLRESINQDQMQLNDIYARDLAEVNAPLISKLVTRISENVERLNRIEVGKELDLVKQFTNSMKKRLLELGYEDKDILALTENEKLKIIADSIAYKDNIIIRALKEEPPESIKGIEKPPEPIPSEGGTKVAVKEKVEVKPEIKKKAMTPEELEKLMKEKTEAKPEVKPEIKTTTIEKISPKVESRTNIDTFILPDVDVVPYYALVWENGQIVVKLITPEILRRGYVEVITKDGILTVGGEDLRTMSVDQIKKLLQTLEGNELKEAYKYYTVLYPSLAPAIKEQIGVREQEQIKAQESLQQQLKVQEQTKLQEQIKEQLKTQEQTQLQTGLQTQLQIQEQIKQQQKLKEEEALKTKVIIPPIVLTPKQQQQLEKIKTLLRPLSLTWRQGKVRWILPPREDGSYHNEDKFAVSSKTIVPGVTKYYEGEGSAYATLEFIGGKSQLPFKETDVDLGFSIIHLNEVNGELKMDVNPDESANWEGVNKYTKIKEEKEQELQYQEWRARYTGKPPEDVSMPIPVRVKPFKETPLEMHKVEWIPYSKWNDSPVKVYKVDGKYVRENIDPDFTQGGHWLVYNYVPKNEVWIERMRNPEEDKLSLGHELDEINDMDKNDETYEDAHQAAIEREFGRVRRNPQSVDAEIENALSKFVHYETNEKKPEKIPEMKVQERIQRSRKKTIIDTSKRYYLGHETRQPELVANL